MYDRLTKSIMKIVIKEDSNCIDIGCHKGEMLKDIIKLSPKGKHFAYEPIPYLYNCLKKEFYGNVTIFPYALSNETGMTTFQYVKNAPAYSGLKERKYHIKKPNIEEITVEVKRLDETIPQTIHIDFIKIDVEGAEVGVLKGGAEILKKYKPFVVFECGLGASEFYDTKPGELYDFLVIEIGLNVSLLKDFLKNNHSLTKEEFVSHYKNNTEYYFIVYP